MATINIGISEDHRREIADGLTRFLTDTYGLYLKTHIFHWNIEGPMFNTLHLMFEQQYTEIWAAVDAIAERIRTLGFYISPYFTEYKTKTSEQSQLKDTEMLKQLVEGQEAVIRTAREVLQTAEAAHDQTSVDLLTRRMEIHEKNAWMLRSLLV